MKTRAFDPIEGRWRTDYVVTPDGEISMMTAGKDFFIDQSINLIRQPDWKLSRLYENHMNINQEIWEHDIVKCKVLGSGEHIGTVVFVDGCFDVQFQYPIKFLDGVVRDRYYVKCFTVNHAIGVIGNIFQNPELLEEVNK